MKTIISILAVMTTLATAAAAESSRPQEKAPAGETKGPSISEQLATAKQQLAKLRKRYMDKHPLVVEQLRSIAELEKRLADEKR